MTTRYCPRCNAEVEDTGGFCLLGHPLKLHAPVDSLAALRAEVDRAFAPAPDPVGAAVARGRVPEEKRAAVAPPPPPPESRPQSPLRHNPFDDLSLPADVDGSDPINAFSPAPRMDWGPSRIGVLKRWSGRRS